MRYILHIKVDSLLGHENLIKIRERVMLDLGHLKNDYEIIITDERIVIQVYPKFLYQFKLLLKRWGDKVKIWLRRFNNLILG